MEKHYEQPRWFKDYARNGIAFWTVTARVFFPK